MKIIISKSKLGYWQAERCGQIIPATPRSELVTPLAIWLRLKFPKDLIGVKAADLGPRIEYRSVASGSDGILWLSKWKARWPMLAGK